MEFQDKVIKCLECAKEFTYTVDDQKRFAERGFHSEPKRCAECRQARKERTQAHQKGGKASYGITGGEDRWSDRPPRREFGGGGGGFRGGRRSGGGGGGGGGGGRGGFGGESRQSFDAVCAACGAKTTVPFEPTQGREVY